MDEHNRGEYPPSCSVGAHPSTLPFALFDRYEQRLYVCNCNCNCNC